MNLDSSNDATNEFALISDIHSNYAALEKVLKEIRLCGLEKIYCLGDLSGYGPFPDRVFPLLAKHNVVTVLGNYDEALGFDKGDCGCYYTNSKDIERGTISLQFAKKDTSEENKSWLRNLPRSIDLEVNGLNI